MSAPAHERAARHGKSSGIQSDHRLRGEEDLTFTLERKISGSGLLNEAAHRPPEIIDAIDGLEWGSLSG